MARLKDSKITQVVLGEARITFIGAAPRLIGRLAYMDDVGTTYGQTTLAMFSRRTWDLADALRRSMENDMVDALEPRGETDPEIEGPGESNAFDDAEAGGLTFGKDEA